MKARIISSHLTEQYLRDYGNGRIFIETGTYLGDTVFLALSSKLYDEIHSIELNKQLYDQAVVMFADESRVHLWNGDSSDMMVKVCDGLVHPATFWLDAHASGPLAGGKAGGSPVLDELNIIKSTGVKDHTIFIDDRRLFGSEEWSGVKEEDAIALLKEINPEYKIIYLDGHVAGDVLCATVR